MKSPINKLGLEAIFCLNLERRPDRKLHAIDQFKKYGIEDVTFITAIDGNSLDLPKPDQFQDIIQPKREVITPGMVGCFDSHKMIMKYCLEKRINSYLVFEDDLLLMDGFNEFMSIALPAIPKDWDFAYLGCTEHNGFGTHREKKNDFWVIPASAWGTQAFMIKGRKAIQKIYDGLENMQMQIDCQLSLITLPQSGLNYYSIFPSAVGQYWDIGSDVQDRSANEQKFNLI